jgi:catechol-2,3-dioxygenase
MALRLSHLNLPAREPLALAAWYEQKFGFERREAFLLAPGTLLVFERGEPVPMVGNTHFGFQVDSEAEVLEWAAQFGAEVERAPGFASMKTCDPEGNCFEIYWELD